MTFIHTCQHAFTLIRQRGDLQLTSIIGFNQGDLQIGRRQPALAFRWPFDKQHRATGYVISDSQELQLLGVRQAVQV